MAIAPDVERSALMLQQREYIQTAQLLEQYLIKNPHDPMAWNNRGLAFIHLGHPFDARIHFDKAIQFDPKGSEYYCNRGVAAYQLNLFDEALNFYLQAKGINPDHVETNLNVGNLYKMQGKLPEALDYYRRCVAIRPEYAMGHLLMSHCLLAMGQYEEGWKEFEWRWKSDQLVPRGLRVPSWEGENLNDKSILVYAEQGFGDGLQFARYAPLIKKQYPNSRVYLEVRPPLARLMKTVAGVDAVYAFGDRLPHLDYCVAMMSLPRVMGTTVDTIPSVHRLFRPDPDRSAMWHDKLALLPPGLRVGLCWAGMSRPGRPEADAVDRKRSTTLQTFAPLALVPGVSWVCLQKGPPEEQVGKPPAGMTIGTWMDDCDDFYDTASLIDCLDLVISVDTAIVHVAASLGKPTWLLSRHDGCWRWLGNRSDSPWYDSLTQFVQPTPGEWGPMMNEVALRLKQFVEERRAAKAA